jgi:hypothetical protein
MNKTTMEGVREPGKADRRRRFETWRRAGGETAVICFDGRGGARLANAP